MVASLASPDGRCELRTRCPLCFFDCSCIGCYANAAIHRPRLSAMCRYDVSLDVQLRFSDGCQLKLRGGSFATALDEHLPVSGGCPLNQRGDTFATLVLCTPLALRGDMCAEPSMGIWLFSVGCLNRAGPPGRNWSAPKLDRGTQASHAMLTVGPLIYKPSYE